jgi:hypothetical protein
MVGAGQASQMIAARFGLNWTMSALIVVMFFFTPVETGSPENQPLFTIPA